MGYIRLWRPQFWSAGASEARPRFGSLGREFRHSQSAVAAALCRRTPKVPRVAYPADSSVTRGFWPAGRLFVPSLERLRQTPGLKEMIGSALQPVNALREIERRRQLGQRNQPARREGASHFGNIGHAQDIEQGRPLPVRSRRVVQDDLLDASVKQRRIQRE